jgi:hypothetical protein
VPTMFVSSSAPLDLGRRPHWTLNAAYGARQTGSTFQLSPRGHRRPSLATVAARKGCVENLAGPEHWAPLGELPVSRGCVGSTLLGHGASPLPARATVHTPISTGLERDLDAVSSRLEKRSHATSCSNERRSRGVTATQRVSKP